MQEQSNEDLAKSFKASQNELETIDEGYIAIVIDLIKERAAFISDFWDLTHYFFSAPKSFDEKASKKAFKEGAKEVLGKVIKLVNSVDDYTAENVQNTIKSWITANDIGFGRVMMPLRLSLVGALQGPDVFDIMFMIGKKETIKRVENAIAFMG
jgi:glutamyl-tRNA synthetase